MERIMDERTKSIKKIMGLYRKQQEEHPPQAVVVKLPAATTGVGAPMVLLVGDGSTVRKIHPTIGKRRRFRGGTFQPDPYKFTDHHKHKLSKEDMGEFKKSLDKLRDNGFFEEELHSLSDIPMERTYVANFQFYYDNVPNNVHKKSLTGYITSITIPEGKEIFKNRVEKAYPNVTVISIDYKEM